MSVSPKSPLAVTELMVNPAVPEFVSVTFFALLVVPIACMLNVRLVGEKLALGAVPVPLRFMLCGLLLASVVIVRLPNREPVAVGVNGTVIVQLAPGFKLDPQLSLCAKSPVVAMPLMFSITVWLFVSSTFCPTLVVPTSCAAKLKLVGDTLVGPGLVQDEKLKDAIRVFQFRFPLVEKYSPVYQNVQSSAGSIVMLL